MKVGIIGMPNAGKSSLFNALTRAGAQAANYPFTTIEPNVAVVPVTDERLEKVAETVGASEIVPDTSSSPAMANVYADHDHATAGTVVPRALATSGSIGTTTWPPNGPRNPPRFSAHNRVRGPRAATAEPSTTLRSTAAPPRRTTARV